MSVRTAPPRRRQSNAEVVVIDGHPIRIGSWQGSDRVAYLAPLGDSHLPGPVTVRDVMARLAARGFDEVVTAAVPEPDAAPFLDVGFVERERLHLLAHPLVGVPPTPWHATRRARAGDRNRVLGMDHRAFEPFWQLDADGLEDAIHATPVSRYRVTQGRHRPRRRSITGYAVFGLAGKRGYLQRLAVDPDLRRQGLATTLVNDGLGWLVRRGATSALVNTQERNEKALRLYLRLGFVREPYKLVVLWSTLLPTAHPAPLP